MISKYIAGHPEDPGAVLVTKETYPLTVAYAAVSFLCGYAAWSGDVTLLPLSWGFVVLWALSQTRLSAFIVALMYYLAASRGMLAGASLFFADPAGVPVYAIGTGLWLLSGAILGGVWALGWGRRHIWARVLVVLAVVSVPPLGFIGWANPITAAGALFPGWGWSGLALSLIILAALSHVMTRPLPRRAAIAAGVLVSVGAASFVAHTTAGIVPARNSIAINTDVGQSSDPYSQVRATRALAKKMRRVVASGREGVMYVLPESVAGDWSLNRPYWDKVDEAAREKNSVVLVGGWMPLPGGRYQNALFAVGASQDYQINQRVPIPISMWKPFTQSGAEPYFFGSGVVKILGENTASLVCYEQLLVWPVLVSMYHRPTVVLSISNTWWAKNTSIPVIQEEITAAWAKLFGVPYVFAINK